MRYLIKYTKGSNIKFVAHLDLMRTIQRTFKRSNLPVEYSKGFNPHMKLSIAQPLSVGVYSDGEYLDIDFYEAVDEEEIKERFNAFSTEDIKLIKVVKVNDLYEKSGKKIPQAMAALDGASYEIKIKYKNTNKLEEEIKEIKERKEWNIVKKTKNSEKEVNIKPMVKSFITFVKGDYLEVKALVSCGSRENLSADLLSEYIKSNTSNLEQFAFTEIKREDLYGLKGEALVPLWEYFKSK